MDIAYQIPRAGLVWVLLSVILVMAPHSMRMPLWISVIMALCIFWRILIFLGKLDYPGKAMRLFVVVFALVVSLSELQSLEIGLETAASLLALGFVFKLTEMKSKRDIYIVMSLCFIMALVSFIFSQSVFTTMYLGLVVLVNIAAMVSLNRSALAYSFPGTLRIAVRIMAQSVPLMIVLFLVVPRIEPLWSVPTQEISGSTGVGDEMSPGDISRLGRSDELAFRVSFENSLPPLHENLYWRGLVLDNFDGNVWRRSLNAPIPPVLDEYDAAEIGRPNPEYSVSGNPLRYNIILEPTRQSWLYGLHLAEPVSNSISIGRNFELLNSTFVNQRFSYDLVSYRNNKTDLQLSGATRRRSLALPQGGNVRSRQLAASLRRDSDSDRDYAYNVLAIFQQQPFYYTLNPPLLGANRIDDFLFNTREGFCEHYASSFTFMMRAAGVPARVVVGYQGAEYNRFEDYMMVYQYNAHAWTEVWLEGEGWVRFDPTSIVSPERIRVGVESALQDDPAFMNDSRRLLTRFRNTDWLNTLRLRLDALEYEWNRRVVSYDRELQFKLFEQFFGSVTLKKMLAVVAIAVAFVLFLISLSIFRIRPAKDRSVLDRLYAGFCRDLARLGYPRKCGEGPEDYCLRVSALRPELESDMARITRQFMQLNYCSTAPQGKRLRHFLGRFKHDLRKFRIRSVTLSNSLLRS